MGTCTCILNHQTWHDTNKVPVIVQYNYEDLKDVVGSLLCYVHSLRDSNNQAFQINYFLAELLQFHGGSNLRELLLP